MAYILQNRQFVKVKALAWFSVPTHPHYKYFIYKRVNGEFTIYEKNSGVSLTSRFSMGDVLSSGKALINDISEQAIHDHTRQRMMDEGIIYDNRNIR